MGKTEKKLLIVDDEVAILVLYESYFQDMGYQVATASSGPEALEILESVSFPVILVDMLMPEMDGLQLCREIRNRGIRATMIAVTGYPTQFEFSDCRNAGFDGYLSKPVNMGMLFDVVEKGIKTFRSSFS